MKTRPFSLRNLKEKVLILLHLAFPFTNEVNYDKIAKNEFHFIHTKNIFTNIISLQFFVNTKLQI